MRNQKLKLLSYVVMAYMLLAFTWWALLLFTKNKDVFHAKQGLVKIGMIAEGLVQNQAEFEQMPDYQALQREYKRQEWMIFGEASVFVMTLVAGMWFIHKSYSREVQANQQQRNFLLSITHELKSPIASIRLVLETLIKWDLPKGKTDQLATSALKENERLHQLVENLLLSAKLETAYQPDFEEVDLDALLQNLFAEAIERHPKMKLVYDKKGNLPLMKLDRSGITLLVNNLVGNAAKYSEGPAEIEAHLEANSKYATLTFADRGIGIPDDEKQSVFEKFYRVGSEETRKTKGTGLGLFIVNQIVKAHNGSIQILDNQPQGTVFKIGLGLGNS